VSVILQLGNYPQPPPEAVLRRFHLAVDDQPPVLLDQAVSRDHYWLPAIPYGSLVQIALAYVNSQAEEIQGDPQIGILTFTIGDGPAVLPKDGPFGVTGRKELRPLPASATPAKSRRKRRQAREQAHGLQASEQEAIPETPVSGSADQGAETAGPDLTA
jgi:hypothetical protein